MERNRQLPLTETVYYILLAVIEPAHGYLIIQKIDQLSNGQVKMAAGTLYGAIENLTKLQFIQPITSRDSRRKVYEITEKGREILLLDQSRMQHMINVTTSLLNNEEEDNR
ncbi:putative transcriptional regulator [Bacillus sp. TS-2]|nr:putative transcriptional regulator [Bacillus sp. TS-2]